MGPRFESVKVHQRPVGQVVKTAASHAVNIGSNPVRVTRRRSKVRFAPAVFLRQIPTVGSETCGVFVQYRGTAGRRPGTVAAVRRGGLDSTGHTGSAPAVPLAGGDTRQVYGCHCYENKVGILPKRVQETNPEPGRVFSVRLCSGHSRCWGAASLDFVVCSDSS